MQLPPRLPHAAFSIINPTVRLLLRSPLHRLWSTNLMLITFRGRSSGRLFTTPVRYQKQGDLIRCFTSQSNQWWRNLRGGADVVLRIGGEDVPCRAESIQGDAARVRAGLAQFLDQYPQDSPYYDVHLGKDKRPVASEMERAACVTVMVEAKRHAGATRTHVAPTPAA